ncbi:hypothetical protein BFN02_13225 [Staphylococcus equorum]|nr:hypothetical protein BFN02_13225 [Staphylococcus equorum]
MGSRALDQRHRHRPGGLGGPAVAAPVTGCGGVQHGIHRFDDRAAAARAVLGVEGRGLGPDPGDGRRPSARGHPGDRRQSGHRRHPVGGASARLGGRPGGRARGAQRPSAAWPAGVRR